MSGAPRNEAGHVPGLSPSRQPDYKRRYRHTSRLQVLKRLEADPTDTGSAAMSSKAARLRRTIQRYAHETYDEFDYLPPTNLVGEADAFRRSRRSAVEIAKVSWDVEITNQIYVSNPYKDVPMSTKQKQQQQEPAWVCSPEFYESTVLPLVNEAQQRLKSIRLVSTRLGKEPGWATAVKAGNRKIVSRASVDGLNALVADLRADEKAKADKAAARQASEAERLVANAEASGMKVEPLTLRSGEVVAATPSVISDVSKKIAGENAKDALNGKGDPDFGRIAPGTERQLDQIRALHSGLLDQGLMKAEAAKAFGYGSSAGVYMFLTGRADKMPRWRIERAVLTLDALKRGDRNEAERLMSLPKPLDKAEHPADSDPNRELAGQTREIRRIGPTPEPRTAPRYQPVAPPTPIVKVSSAPIAPPVTDFAQLEEQARAAQRPDLGTAWERTVLWAAPALFPASIASGLRHATLKEQNGDVIAYVSMTTHQAINSAVDSTRRRISTMQDKLQQELGRAVSLTIAPPEYQQEEQPHSIMVERPRDPNAVVPEAAKRSRAELIGDMRDRLTHIALVEFDQIKQADLEGQPKFLHVAITDAWNRKRDELITFVEGLE